jgi:hypothetical protein
MPDDPAQTGERQALHAAGVFRVWFTAVLWRSSCGLRRREIDLLASLDASAGGSDDSLRVPIFLRRDLDGAELSLPASAWTRAATSNPL